PSRSPPLIHTLALHDALPIYNLANVATAGFKADALILEEAPATRAHAEEDPRQIRFVRDIGIMHGMEQGPIATTGNPLDLAIEGDRKSTRLTSSHVTISYAVF